MIVLFPTLVRVVPTMLPLPTTVFEWSPMGVGDRREGGLTCVLCIDSIKCSALTTLLPLSSLRSHAARTCLEEQPQGDAAACKLEVASFGRLAC